MLTFRKSFFETETRCDFTVDSTMKTCWAAQMELLAEIDRVCVKYDIPYVVYYGTLLGCVRHQGYVPWDDDIDIALLREDFDRLMSVLKDELPAECVVHNPLTDDDSTEFWASVANADTISIEPSRLQKYHGCPFMVGIDIYPLDKVPDDPAARNQLLEDCRWLWTTYRLAKNKEDKTREEEESLEKLLEELERRYHTRFRSDKPYPAQILRIAHRVARDQKMHSCSTVSVYHNFLSMPECLLQEEWFKNIQLAPFEELMLPIPDHAGDILSALYGDYMVIKPMTQSHDYPFYNRQLELLRQLSAQNQGDI